jgi:hypothetical protein
LLNFLPTRSSAEETPGITIKWLRPRLSSVWAVVSIAIPVAIVNVCPFLAPDLAYQIRLGDLMRDSGSLIRTDMLTFTAAGLPWMDQQWGAQILTSLAFEYGWFGLAILRMLLVIAVLALVYKACAVTSKRLAAGLTIGSAMLLMGGFQLRPQTFGMLCFVALFWLIAGRRLHPNRLWWILPIVVLWTNLHGSFFLAPMILLGALIEDLYDRKPLRSLPYVALAAIFATLANPIGIRIWSYVWKISTNPVIRNLIDEWKPPTIYVYSGALFFLSASILVLFIARRREPMALAPLAWLGAFFALGLTATRSVFWWALAAPIIISQMLRRPDKERPNPRNYGNLLVICVVAGILLFSLVRWSPYISAESVPPSQFLLSAPTDITQKLQEEVRSGERLFVTQNWASWFELKLPFNPVAVDSRIELYHPEVWSNYLAVTQGRCGWQNILDQWNVEVAVLSHVQQKNLIPLMKSDAGWQLVYQDNDGAIFRRLESIAPYERPN